MYVSIITTRNDINHEIVLLSDKRIHLKPEIFFEPTTKNENLKLESFLNLKITSFRLSTFDFGHISKYLC
jgi:hypothetical protein